MFPEQPPPREGEPVIGYRNWAVDPVGVGLTVEFRLKSLARDWYWQAEGNEAICMTSGRPCDESPGWHCGCGFWALDDADEALARAAVPLIGSVFAAGLIVGSGRMIRHQDQGWRMARARVVALAEHVANEAIREVGAAYGVAVLQPEEMKRLGAEARLWGVGRLGLKVPAR